MSWWQLVQITALTSIVIGRTPVRGSFPSTERVHFGASNAGSWSLELAQAAAAETVQKRRRAVGLSMDVPHDVSGCVRSQAPVRDAFGATGEALVPACSPLTL